MCPFVLFCRVKRCVRMISFTGFPILDSSYTDSPDTSTDTSFSSRVSESEGYRDKSHYTWQLHSQNPPPGGRIIPSKSPFAQPHVWFFFWAWFFLFQKFSSVQKSTGLGMQLSWQRACVASMRPEVTSPAPKSWVWCPRLEPCYCRGSQVAGEHGVQIKLKVTLN